MQAGTTDGGVNREELRQLGNTPLHITIVRVTGAAGHSVWAKTIL